MRRPAAPRWLLATGLAAASSAWAGQAATCTGVAECRGQAEAAIAQGDFERAHDLGWRTVQQGPRNDRTLMFLLARTQALSGRPGDALVMIRRLAELGASVDVSADEFARMRELPGWPAVEAWVAGEAGRAGGAGEASASGAAAMTKAPNAHAALAPPVAPAAPVAPSAPPALPALPALPAPPAPEVLVPVVVDEAGHFTGGEFAPGGLACDAVSRRFVFGDRRGRKLLVVAEGSDHSIDLTRADVAGFLDVTALDIDTTNGNLWVASAEADGRGATLHRVQLISGRPLAAYAVPEALAPAQPMDVAMAAPGVLMLDAAQRRVLILRAGAQAITALASLGEMVPLSLTAGRHSSVAYVTHRDGLLAVDLRTRAVTPVTAPKTIALGRIERLRRHGAGLVGVQALPDGSRRLVRLSLDARGRTVTRLRVLDVLLPSGAAPIPLAVCGDTLGFVVNRSAMTSPPTSTAWTIRRVELKR